MEKDNHSPKNDRETIITRKEALHKAGKYAAFTAASMLLLMSPADSSAQIKSPMKPKHH